MWMLCLAYSHYWYVNYTIEIPLFSINTYFSHAKAKWQQFGKGNHRSDSVSNHFCLWIIIYPCDRRHWIFVTWIYVRWLRSENRGQYVPNTSLLDIFYKVLTSRNSGIWKEEVSPLRNIPTSHTRLRVNSSKPLAVRKSIKTNQTKINPRDQTCKIRISKYLPDL